jgi:hypothetical protein
MSSPLQPASQTSFLARCMRWDWHDDVRIDVLDDAGRPICTLDEWQTMVFHEADGQQTLDQIIAMFPTHYRDPAKIPAMYPRKLADAARFLIEEHHWIELRDRRNPLQDGLTLPASEHADAGKPP